MIFSHKNKKDFTSRISRIPYANFTLAPYKITPKTKSLAKNLTEYLKMIIKGSPDSFDSLNGNAFDNIIDNWANRAKVEIENQRPSRAEVIKNLSSARIANKQNAEDWIKKDTESLNDIIRKINIYENAENEEFI